jgi:hypothetical protein
MKCYIFESEGSVIVILDYYEVNAYTRARLWCKSNNLNEDVVLTEVRPAIAGVMYAWSRDY